MKLSSAVRRECGTSVRSVSSAITASALPGPLTRTVLFPVTPGDTATPEASVAGPSNAPDFSRIRRPALLPAMYAATVALQALDADPERVVALQLLGVAIADGEDAVAAAEVRARDLARGLVGEPQRLRLEDVVDRGVFHPDRAVLRIAEHVLRHGDVAAELSASGELVEHMRDEGVGPLRNRLRRRRQRHRK